ncbi:MAG TPA: hypothetical protein PLE61_12930 [Vicinamibacterales bacterium]|nr:hypothetical protein [Vicinamibacterales bacterium]HPW21704.1 hypothetical protein [Vicinamibacterales bacterium]
MRSPVVAVALAVMASGLALTSVPASAEREGTRPAEAAPPDLRALRQRTEERFRIVEIRGGMILIPRSDAAGVRTIDVNDGRVLLDGTAVTGRELRDRLGRDADLVAQLSFLDAEGCRAFFAAATAGIPSPESEAPGAPGRPALPDVSGWPKAAWGRHGGARVRIGGDVIVGRDEAVSDVVVVLGSARVDGLVESSVVAVGGSVVLGPTARVRGDVTSIGGGVECDPGAVLEGESNEIAFSGPHLGPLLRVRPWRDWRWVIAPFDGRPRGTVDLLTTLVRLGLAALFAAIVAAVAPGAVRGVSDRAAAEPWRAGLVGLAAELLFVPLLVLTVAVLAISIIGIPLLLLVPFGLIAVGLAFVLGLAGAGRALGTCVARRVGGAAPGMAASLVLGLAVIWALTAVARFVGLLGPPAGFFVAGLLVAGFLVEYVAWTVGLGAVILSRFGRRRSAPAGPGFSGAVA